MDLWTEFEGVTIGSAFALKKLLRSEGRSAFFSTSNATGEPVLIRIIECHFDEDEIQARWRGVQALGHPNFLRIDHFGQFLIEADDITSVYVVFERVDANLGQVLERGRLSAADVAQIGLSAASALETLHTHGFVHEHVEARNIFAVGESVKLRSDCVRETPEGAAGLEARRRDVHDLALLLMQVLLGQPRLTQETLQTALPEPFDEIVRKGMGGEWGLAEIQSALAGFKGSKAAKARPPIASGARGVAQTTAVDAGSISFSAEKRSESQKRAPASSEGSAVQSAFRFDRHVRFEPEFSVPGFRKPPLRGIAAGALLAIVVLFGWIFLHRVVNGGASAAAHPVAAPPATAGPSHPAPGPRAASLSRAGAATPQASPHGATQWRVVAFTYDRKDQAQAKATSLSQKHPELRPEAFSPSGRSPWLVTVGGAMERDAAYALARKAHSAGLPRDTYAQNYTAR